MLKIGLIVASVLSILFGIFGSISSTDTVFQQLVNQNYITHGLLFGLFFLGLAFLCNLPKNKPNESSLEPKE